MTFRSIKNAAKNILKQILLFIVLFAAFLLFVRAVEYSSSKNDDQIKHTTVEYNIDDTTSITVTYEYKNRDIGKALNLLGENPLCLHIDSKEAVLFKRAVLYQIDQIDLADDNAETVLKKNITESINNTPMIVSDIKINTINDWFRKEADA